MLDSVVRERCSADRRGEGSGSFEVGEDVVEGFSKRESLLLVLPERRRGRRLWPGKRVLSSSLLAGCGA